jgi:hypothetical protein
VAQLQRLELVTGHLWVDLHDHRLNLGDTQARCWTAVTDGLVNVGQQEIVMTVVPDPSEAEAFPPGLLGYLAAVREFALAGQIVGAGGVSGYRAPGPLEFGNFVGVAFSKASNDHEIVLPAGSLQALLLTEGEFEMAHRCSAWRVFARLGQNARFYPWPFWSDPTRSETYRPGDAENSVLAKVSKLSMGRLDSSLDGSHLRAVLSPDDAATVVSQLADKRVAVIVPPPDPTSMATLVWTPGQAEPMAISADPTLTTFVSARFLIVVADQSSDDEVRFQEDGFAILATGATNEILIDHLRRGIDYTLTSSVGDRSVTFSNH